MKTRSDDLVTNPSPRAVARLAAVLLLVLSAAAPAAAAAAPSDGPRWHDRVEPALAEAEATGKLILVDLYADWCGWCKKLDVEFRTEHFTRFAEDYVLLRVDVEDRGEGTALQKYLEVRALPALGLMDHRKVRAGVVYGFKPAPALTTAIRRTAAAWRQDLEQIEQLVAEGDREERLRAADALRAMGDGAGAAGVYRDVLHRDRAGMEPAARARVGAALAHALLMADDAEGARRALQEARQMVERASGEGRARAEQLLDMIDLRLADRLDDCPQRRALEEFLREHPASSAADTVRDRLAELRAGPASECPSEGSAG